ncbi:MAG: PH domain-containing protein [Bacillota bacterium]
MGFLGGTSSSVSKDISKKYLIREESIICNYKFKRNLICLTDKRIIFINKSLFSRKIESKSVPFKKIESISLIQSRKLFSFSDKIILSAISKNYEIKISKSENIFDLYNTLIKLICN